MQDLSEETVGYPAAMTKAFEMIMKKNEEMEKELAEIKQEREEIKQWMKKERELWELQGEKMKNHDAQLKIQEDDINDLKGNTDVLRLELEVQEHEDRLTLTNVLLDRARDIAAERRNRFA